ncbi:MAG: response regulator [Oscillospiraceae bacterium]|nr:response regulator [Oscillospiraceae bacterium]
MGKRILIVDDAAFMRMMLRDILVVKGFEIAGEAENGIEAGAMYKRLRPDLVLMDITMPEMDGIKAVQEILKTDPDARIVMVSAMGQQAMVIQSIKAGAMDFVVKPFHTDRVVDAVNKALFDTVVN